MSRYCLLFLLWGLLYLPAAGAKKVRFSEEELAKESVLPVFDPMFMVLSRNITLAKRFEVGINVSFGLDEPFYFPVYAAGDLSFYLSEAHGVSLTAVYFPPVQNLPAWLTFMKWGGLELRETRGVNVWRVPYPLSAGFLNYQYTPFYGKISLTKQTALNLSMFGFIGPGLIVFNEGAVSPAGNTGIGMKLYFNRWIAVTGVLRFYGYHGPAPAKIPLKSGTSDFSYQSIPTVQKGLIIHLTGSVGVAVLI